ncbi:hypothetical protein TNCV_4778181 [Trichonephila clavipes]|nr:hypothetical protein TNCV_4778181 [Trichonephila clavipes]
MRYAADVENEHDFLNTGIEISVFIGILLLIDYHPHTFKLDYWSDAEDLDITLQEKQRRYQIEDCKGKPKIYYGKDDKTLGQACFGPFHQN